MNSDESSNINYHGEKDISIKIRSIDKEFLVEMNTQENIESLKHKIENISKVPSARQRLIFRGKLLQDNDTLSFHKITHLDVIHLVAKIGEATSEEHAMAIDSNNPSRESRRDSAILGLLNRIFRSEIQNSSQATTESTAQSNTNPSPLSGVLPSLFGRRVRRTTREEGLHSANSEFNSIECRETISQSLATMDNLIQCGEVGANLNLNENYLNSNANTNTPTNLFDFCKRRLQKGQWVDVKDTIDQWLEAQVIDIMGDKVYIHYNGWGTRWDEWIDMKSPRIMPFRYHTRQTTITNFQSPFPNVRPDANVNLFGRSPRGSFSCISNSNNNNNISIYSTTSNDFFDVLDEAQKVMTITNSLIEEINETRNSVTWHKERASKEDVNMQNTISPDVENTNTVKYRRQRHVYSTSKKLVPLLDRLGRLITDVGSYINYDLRNNKMDDLDYSLFNNNEGNLDPVFKPLSPDSQIQQSEERSSISAGSTRNSNARIPLDANRMDQLIINQVPVMDTPLNIISRSSQTQPVIDIYVHTFVTPLSGERPQRDGGTQGTSASHLTTAEVRTTSATSNANERSVPNLINNIISTVIEGRNQECPGVNITNQTNINSQPCITTHQHDTDGTEDIENQHQNFIGRKRAKDNSEVQGGEPHNFKRVRGFSLDEEEDKDKDNENMQFNQSKCNNKNINQEEKENTTNKGKNDEYEPPESNDHKKKTGD